jgi:phosphatidylglycerol lysyltransferase
MRTDTPARDRLRRVLPAVVGLFLFVAALEVLRIELHAVTWHELNADVRQTPVLRIVFALALTVLNYTVLTGYDFLAFAYVGRVASRVRIAGVSFLAYAISNNVGLAMLSGASVRYRFYTRWGLTVEELSRIVLSYSVTFWLGLLALGGLRLALSPIAAGIPAQGVVAVAGWLLLFVPVCYLVAAAVRRRPIRIRGFEIQMPSPAIAGAQVLLSSVEWVLAGSVLYVLLPAGAISFLPFLGAFLAAILVGMVSHVPGGVGVFEGLMVLLLKPYLTSGQLLPALVVYRAVYYLVPLGVAVTGLIADEVRQRRVPVARVGAAFMRLSNQFAPVVSAVLVFIAGVVLLLSGSTPAATGRLAVVNRLFPLGVIEVSHFLGSVAGATLLILSQGLYRRLDAAYYFAAVTIVTGMIASLLKGYDYEEAALLLVVLLVLIGARRAFDRRAAFFDTRFSGGWIAAVAGAVAASVWLGLFAFKHVDYSRELWWQFEIQSDVSRFLRASVGASMVVLLFGVARLVGYAPHDAIEPSDADLEDARRIIATQPSTYPYLACLGDKSLLFNDDRSAFLMYGVQGRTWVALRDPVGDDERMADLIRRFLDRCGDFGGVPVFYEVGKANLHRYADFGLTFAKLGEEAIVDLRTFTMDGGRSAKFRQVVRRLEKDGASFRVVEPSEVHAIMPRLREVSDDWLAAKATAEKGFSLGFFNEAYLQRFPVAVIERGGQIQAFANLWTGAGHEELSIDLMRYHRDAPKSVMEGLFVYLLKWGHEQGYRQFVLGMAPLSGFEGSAVASMWNRLGAFIYEHGESVYGFQGLRAYKQKFDPLWAPHYLAYPGGLRLPRIMADVSALISGGYRQIFGK